MVSLVDFPEFLYDSLVRDNPPPSRARPELGAREGDVPRGAVQQEPHMRYAVKDKPDFLYSAAVIGSELTKLTLSTQ